LDVFVVTPNHIYGIVWIVNNVISRPLEDLEFREDLLDIALIEEACREEGPDISLDEYRRQKSPACSSKPL
jgi:hypothetical protein